MTKAQKIFIGVYVVLILLTIAWIGNKQLNLDGNPIGQYGIKGTVEQGILPPNDYGVASRTITQENMEKTICNKDWKTSSVRPPSSLTSALKKQQLKEMGYKDTDITHFSEDHVISLWLGGAPRDPKNLFPQLHPYSYQKDKLEYYLHTLVCKGDISLRDAQNRLSNNWLHWYNYYDLGTKMAGVTVVDEGEE